MTRRQQEIVNQLADELRSGPKPGLALRMAVGGSPNLVLQVLREHPECFRREGEGQSTLWHLVAEPPMTIIVPAAPRPLTLT
jgi:hypothetical protein